MATSIIDRVYAQITGEVFNRTGITVAPFFGDLADLKSGRVHLGEYQIAPACCGPIGMIFRQIKVLIFAGIDAHRNNLHITFKFAYDHSGRGGSNGHDIEVIVPCCDQI